MTDEEYNKQEELINHVSDNNLEGMIELLKDPSVTLSYMYFMPLQIIVEDNYRILFNYIFDNNLFDFSSDNFFILRVAITECKYYFCNKIMQKYNIEKKWILDNTEVEHHDILISFLSIKNF